MEADFCVEALEEALARYGKPDISAQCDALRDNTDQGSLPGLDPGITSEAFTSVLIANKIAISRDGKGAQAATMSSSSASGNRSNTRRLCAVNGLVRVSNECDALPEMRVGPSKSACRSRLQTATSCIGQEPLW